MKRLIATTTAVMMSGCSLLTPPKAQPIVEDHSSSPRNWRGGVKYGVYTTSAERREVLIKYFKLEDGQWHSTMCAEPSPDVAEAITSSLTGSLTASAQATDAEKAQATIAATQALATSINSLFKRSQGVQFFRDGAFALCTAYLNGWMTTTDYSKAYESLLTASTGLIALEMPNQKQHNLEDIQANADKAAAQAKQSAETGVATEASIKKLLEAVQKAADEAKQSADRAERASTNVGESDKEQGGK